MDKDPRTKYAVKYYAPHTLPFVVMGLCIYLGRWTGIPANLLYPIQTALVAGCLAWFWRDWRDEVRVCADWLAVVAGIAVFAVWVLSEGFYPRMPSTGGDPFASGRGAWVYVFIAFRIFGAAVVVPLAEELFWRSFALRFLIRSDFKSVALGQFSWFSFIAVSLAFGFEHHRWLPGIIAGLVYAGLLYHRKNLFSPILSHAVTNLLLGIYVIATGQWTFW